MLTVAAMNIALLALDETGYGDELLLGAFVSVLIAVTAYAFGIILGLCGAVGKLSGGKPVRIMLDLYTTLFRALPELLLILLLYYAGTDGLNRVIVALGFERIEVNGFVAAIFVLGFVQGAYQTEVWRGAILAVPVGQTEAAKAYGMSPFLRFRRITLPAMLPNAIPGLGNLWLGIIKNSSLISLVGTTELALATKQAAGVSKQYVMFFLAAMTIYLIMTLLSNQILGRLERHVRRGQPKLA
jgi:polar amino acid transport system permease protein